MKSSKIATGLFIFFLLLSTLLTYFPLIRGQEGGCPVNSLQHVGGSAVYELIRTGGEWEYIEPIAYGAIPTLEYGCSTGTRNRVIPVDLYALTFVSAIFAIAANIKKTSRDTSKGKN